jgi:hypothetical protein
MMLLLSLVLVLGAVGVFIGNVTLSEQGQLGPGFQQMIHARVPWLLLAAAVGGAALGVVSLVRARRWYKWAIVPVEIVLAGFLSWYMLDISWLPEHRLALSVGDPFPAYSLVDHDGNPRAMNEGGPRGRALYVFYRGDW